MTQTTQAVLRAMLDEPGKDLYGLEICAATGLPSGTVHPILARFETLGWLDSSWEQIDPREQGRHHHQAASRGRNQLIAWSMRPRATDIDQLTRTW